MRKLWLLLLTSLAAYALGVRPSLAAEATVGVNVVNLQKLDVSQQDAILNDLKAAGVTVIRTGIAPDDNGIDFAKRAFARVSGSILSWACNTDPTRQRVPGFRRSFRTTGAGIRFHIRTLSNSALIFSRC